MPRTKDAIVADIRAVKKQLCNVHLTPEDFAALVRRAGDLHRELDELNPPRRIP